MLRFRVGMRHQALDADPTLEGPRGKGHTFDQIELAGLELLLCGIGETLQPPGRAPNADVNTEAMGALRKVVQEVAELEQEPRAAAIRGRVDVAPPSSGDVNV